MSPENSLTLFREWFNEAKQTEPNDPNAMLLATVDDTGLPNIRVVLMKGFDDDGFVFYTNLESAKGRELLGSGTAAICFDWKSLNRRVTIRGEIKPVSDVEADAYFQSRPRQSRIGAWASQQSRPLKSKGHLLGQVAKFGLKFGAGRVPRPPHWSGFRLRPVHMEFSPDDT